MENELVRGTGIEPVHPYGYKILSLGRLPIPPPALVGKMLTDPTSRVLKSVSQTRFFRHFECLQWVTDFAF